MAGTVEGGHDDVPEMTPHDHNMVMTTVRIAALKARLSEHLRSVRQGRTLTVLDRDTPIARIVPVSVEPLEGCMERATGIEPVLLAWEARALPLC